MILCVILLTVNSKHPWTILSLAYSTQISTVLIAYSTTCMWSDTVSDPCHAGTSEPDWLTTNLNARPQNDERSLSSSLPLHLHHQTKLGAVARTLLRCSHVPGPNEGVVEFLTGTKGNVKGLESFDLGQ